MSERNFKTFFTLADGQVDVRRFSLPGETLSFSVIQEKIQEIYKLSPNAFRILWKDEDGDAITIVNDDDMKPILMKEKDGTVKFEIRNFDSTQQPPVDPNLHVGVTCDGCQNAVRGIRFKCLTCADYDLCFDCERKDEHNDHIMLKIPKPNMRYTAPIIFMARTLRHAEDMASQGKNYCHTAMDAMPADMNALGQQLTDVLGSMGIDATHFVQPPRSGYGTKRRCGPDSCGSCSAPSAAANAALDRRVNETMEHLRAMGFQDNNGSLTNLVRSKNGDLFAVLDILKAQQQSG